MNDANATIGSNALVLDTPEQKLGKETSLVEIKARDMVVTNEEEYAAAGEFLKLLKQQQKKVTEFFEPMRVSAKATYDEILDRKKQMLDPLQTAEKALKAKVGDYVTAIEKARKEREEALRKQAQEEMERKLAEAAAAEAAGDSVGAEFAMAEAEVMDQVAKTGAVRGQTQTVKGVSTRKAWKITHIDLDKVPDTVMGAVIRPVDEAAVMKLINATKGAIQIPGVTFEETASVSVRA